MQLTYTTADGRMSVTVEGDDQRSIFSQIADFQEVFETPTKNIKIGDEEVDSKDVKFQVRKNNDGDEFFELVYCGSNFKLNNYKFEFGCNKKGGGLFPKRKDSEGNWKENNGWTKWQGNKSEGKSDNKSNGKKEKEPF